MPDAGFRRLFINLGKNDGFYPGEVMQFVNKNVKGRQEIGQIDLLSKISYIEVPENDADRVMDALNGARYKGREVRCNDADESGKGRESRPSRGERRTKKHGSESERKSRKGAKKAAATQETGDWRQFFVHNDVKLKGEEPDFSEEGWARRRPKTK